MFRIPLKYTLTTNFMGIPKLNEANALIFVWPNIRFHRIFVIYRIFGRIIVFKRLGLDYISQIFSLELQGILHEKGKTN